jgi:hypothetical protein
LEDIRIEDRISKDIQIFDENLDKVSGAALDKELKRIFDMAKMYASDCKSYLEIGDTVTAFSCISYAHGLLDAIIIILDKS